MIIETKNGNMFCGDTVSSQNTIFTRGRTQKNIIKLPKEWKDIVDFSSITIHLTEFGAKQNLIVRRVDKEEMEVHLQSYGIPIDCYYLIFFERTDIPRPGIDNY